MTDERLPLDHVAELLRPPDDPFERLTRRRRRRRIRQRVTAGLTGLLIAAVGSTSMFVAVRALGDRPTHEGPPPARPPATILKVNCDGTTTNVETARVKPGPLGVAGEIFNSGPALEYSFTYADGAGIGGSVPAHDSIGWQSSAIQPGTNVVKCYRPGQDPKDVSGATFEVVDDDHLWVSTRLNCPDDMRTGATIDYAAPPNDSRDPVEITRDRFAGTLQSDDQVERAGYPGDTEEQFVRVLRGDRVVAVIHFLAGVDGRGPYNLDSYSACSDFVAQ